MFPAVNPNLAQAAPAPDQHITRAEVARRFRVTPDTILRWVKDRPDFPRPFKAGWRWLWRASDIAAYEERIAGGAARATA